MPVRVCRTRSWTAVSARCCDRRWQSERCSTGALSSCRDVRCNGATGRRNHSLAPPFPATKCRRSGQPTKRRGRDTMVATDAGSHELMTGQLGIWSAQQLAPESAAFIVSMYHEIHGDLDVDLLVRAIRRTLDEAEAYRLRFRLVDGEPRQYVDGSGHDEVHVVDVTDRPDPAAAAEEWMREDAGRPIDLLHDPLFTQIVFRIGHRRHFWYQRTHHIAVDGYSGALFTARVAAHYTAIAVDAEPAGPALQPLSELLEADREYRDSEALERDRRYWLGRLADPPEP